MTIYTTKLWKLYQLREQRLNNTASRMEFYKISLNYFQTAHTGDACIDPTA